MTFNLDMIYLFYTVCTNILHFHMFQLCIIKLFPHVQIYMYNPSSTMLARVQYIYDTFSERSSSLNDFLHLVLNFLQLLFHNSAKIQRLLINTSSLLHIC